MTERRKRFARAPGATGLVLTGRDVRLILACWSHRWLTRAQLQSLLPESPCVARFNHRLRRLYDHFYLDRIRAGTIGSGLQPVYLAGEQSIPLIAAETGQSEPTARERLREDGRASAVLLPHDLQVNDVRIALTTAIQRRPSANLVTWQHAQESFDAYRPGCSLRPDGYFQLSSGGTLAAYYVELDRGTTDLGRWRAKVERYLDYRASGAYTARHGLARFRVLTLAPSLPRLQHLRQATRTLADRVFWFGLTSELLEDPNPERVIWRPVGDERQRALVESGETG